MLGIAMTDVPSVSVRAPFPFFLCTSTMADSHYRARAGLLANSGCFVSNKCVLWCFVVCLRVFWDVLRVFCGVLRVFCSISTQHTQHPKNIETHWKHTKNSQYARVLRAFSMSKFFRLYCTKHLSQNICKTLQNTAKHRKTVTKRVLWNYNYVAKHRKTNAKRSKTSQNGRNTAAIRVVYCAHSVYSSKIR